MKITTAALRLIFGNKWSPPGYARWPKRDEVESWMRGKVAHYRAYHPNQAHHLFDLSCGDYLPLTVHATGNFGAAELAMYRNLKAENPDLVKLASKSDGHFLSRSRIYDPEDWPEEDMLP